MRTIPDIASLLALLEDAIRLLLIPAFTGNDYCSGICLLFAVFLLE